MPLSQCSGCYNAYDYLVGSHLYNNVYSSDKTDICEQFYQNFMAHNTHNTIPQNSENSTTQFIKKTPSSSFVMSSVTQAEVRSLFSSLDVQKASLDIRIANKLIKIAAGTPSKPLAYNYIVVTKRRNDLQPPKPSKTTYNHLKPPRKIQQPSTTTSKTYTTTHKQSNTILNKP